MTTYYSVLSDTLTLPVGGILDLEGAAKQAFTAAGAWGFQIIVDGEIIWDFGGTWVQDIVPLSAWKYCDAGSRSIEIKWAGDPSVTLGARFLKVRHFKRLGSS